ncbi:MAG TPA: DUF3551 domain-containing protein [Xanthobacteraceae bacterium]|jgi:hypothetical protein
MRVAFLVLSVLVLTAGIARRAEAQNYPWCANYSKGALNCSFVTYEQCMADVSGIGGFCEQNNTYKPPSALPPRHKPQTHF